MSGPVSNFDVELVTDTAGSTGFGAYFQGRWSAEPWPQSWERAGFLGNLVLLELFPVVLALELWGEACRNLKLRINCDNMGVVQVVNRMSASSHPVIRLLRQLVFRCLSLNILFMRFTFRVWKIRWLTPCLVSSGTSSGSWRRVQTRKEFFDRLGCGSCLWSRRGMDQAVSK